MKELIATIHFIGLCMFTDGASPDRRLHVVLPRIMATGGIHQHINLQASPVPTGPASQFHGTPTPGLGGVEDHTPFLAFRNADLLNVAGWSPQSLPGQAGYSYIVLSGEIITFHTNAPNVRSVKPVGLPSVKCCGKETLLPAFHTVEGSGAAAIVRVAEGTLNTCSSRPQGAVYGGEPRIDTKLTLKNAGVLLVMGDTKQKSRALVLKGDATLYVGNLPSQWVNQSNYQPAHGLTPHYRAYAAMFKHPPTVTACAYKPPAPTVQSTRCNTPDAAFRFGDVPPPSKYGYPPEPVAVSAECSNSTWP